MTRARKDLVQSRMALTTRHAVAVLGRLSGTLHRAQQSDLAGLFERYRSPADASGLRAARSPSRLSLLLGERTFASSGNHECETAGHRGQLQRQRRDAHLRALRRPARSECAEMRSCRGGEPDESFRSGTSRPRSCARATRRKLGEQVVLAARGVGLLAPALLLRRERGPGSGRPGLPECRSSRNGLGLGEPDRPRAPAAAHHWQCCRER